MTNERLKCVEVLGGPHKYWPCSHYAKDGSEYCGVHDPERKAEQAARRKARRGPTKAQIAEEQQKLLDDVIDAARCVCKYEKSDNDYQRSELRVALFKYDRGKK